MKILVNDIDKRDNDTNCRQWTWNGLQMLERKTERTGNQRKNRHHPNHSTVKLS